MTYLKEKVLRVELRSRFGPVNARQFETYANQVIAFCSESFGAYDYKLIRDGARIDPNILHNGKFADEFATAKTMTVKVCPLSSVRSKSFARVQWTSSDSRVLRIEGLTDPRVQHTSRQIIEDLIHNRLIQGLLARRNVIYGVKVIEVDHA